MTRNFSSAERMALNAAMDKLVSRVETGWLEAAQLVADLGRTIEATIDIHQTDYIGTQDRDALTGHAAGIGDVTIKDGEKEEHDERVQKGIIERVGKFKMTHKQHAAMIEFWHYRDDQLWDDPTETKKLCKKHVVRYDHNGVACIYALSIYENRISWRDVPHLIRLYLEVWKVSLSQLLTRGKLRWIQVQYTSMHCVGFQIIHSTVPGVPPGSLLLKPEFIRRRGKK